MDELWSPDGGHVARWRWGGEMWMSGPEWGYLSVDGFEISDGATGDYLWSADSRYLAFVKLHIEEVPDRQGAEGMSTRIGILRREDFRVRYCLGNRKLAVVRLRALSSEAVTASVDGEEVVVDLRHMVWEASDRTLPAHTPRTPSGG